MAATFPGGVKVFTTKQAGDQIASAHINDLQDEVVAVETQLITSKLASLVAAPSGNKVLTSVNGTPTWAIQSPVIGCSLYDTGQTISSATWTSINFTGENFDTDTMHDTVTNNERITIKTAGFYLFIVNINFDYASGLRCVRVTKNGTSTQVVRENKLALNQTGFSDLFNISVILPCSVNDYFIVRVYQSSGGDLNINSTYPIQFGAIKIA